MKRAFTALAAAALALGAAPALASAPAQSSTPSQTLVQGAEAIWYMDVGSVATAVHFTAVQQRDQGPGSSKSVTEGVNVQVFQTWYDAGGDIVSLLYASDPYYAPAESLSVDRLKGASVDATVDLYEQLSGAPPVTVHVTATWAPTGGRTHTFNSLWDTEFGSWTSNKTNQSMVEAVATGSITGGINYGALEETDGTLGTAHTFGMFRPNPIESALTGMLETYAAESRSTYHIDGATSTWEIGGDRSMYVALTAEQDHNASATSPADAWVEIYGSWYDTVTNEDVWLDVSSERQAVYGSKVDPSAQGATVNGTFIVSGTEVRTNAAGDVTFTPVGPYTVTATATWTATGALTQYRTLFIERTPDLVQKELYNSRARTAAATGSISGQVLTSALTNAGNPILYDQTRTYTTR